MTTCSEFNVSKKPAWRCLHLLQIAITVKRPVGQRPLCIGQMMQIIAKIKRLAAGWRQIGRSHRPCQSGLARFGNVYLQIHQSALRARISRS